MAKTRIAVDITLELDAPDPRAILGAVLETLARRIAEADDPFAANGDLAASDGRATWRVRAWDEADLATCASCGRRVPRAETDIREEGEVCSRCALGDAVGAHVEAAVDAGYRAGFTDGAQRDLHLVELLLRGTR
jgi:hypothetical protein